MAKNTRTRKMVNLAIEETSGVDHPAHLHEGWVVMKAANTDSVQDVFDSVYKQEDSVSDIETRLDEALALLQKAEDRIAELEAEAGAVAPADEDVIKSAPEAVQKAFEDMRKQAEEAEAKAAEVQEVLRKEREARADAEAIEKVRGWENLSLNADEVGVALRRLAEVDDSLAKSVTAALESVNAQAESANIFAEIGRTTGISGDSFTQMEAMAKARVSEGKSATFEQALADVAVAEPALYAAYMNEKGA